MAATLVGLQFSASLGKAWPPKQHGTLLIELDLTAARGPIKCSHTGGDVWCLPDGGSGATAFAAGPAAIAAAAGAGPAPPPIKCNAWDSKGRNPAMNVYVHLCPPGGASSFTDEPPPRCKLGVLIQHALPRLAQRVGGYGQVALDWVTWIAEAGVNGAPVPGTVAPFGMPNPAHWLLLQELAKEKETGAGTTVTVQTGPAEDAALRRAKETLVAAAGFFGPEAVAKVSRLTVRKLYQREYHFFDADGKDVADSRRHALEWAVGLARVEEVLGTNPEARAKLNERLTVPPGSAAGVGSAGTGAAAAHQRKRVWVTTGGGTGRRVLLSAGSRSFPAAGSGQLSDAAAAAAAAAAGMLSIPAMPPLAVSMAQSAAVERAASMPLPDGLAPAGAQEQQQQYLLGLLSQVQLPASQQQQQQPQQHQQLVFVSQAVVPQQPPQQQDMSPVVSQGLAMQTPQPLPLLPQLPVSGMEAQPSAQLPQVLSPAQTLPAQQSQQPEPQQQQEQQQQQQQQHDLSQLPLPDPFLLPLSAGGPGTGLSDVLGPHGPPSWLGPEVQLCPAMPAAEEGGHSPSSEVEQPSPARADLPAQRHPCEEHPHPAATRAPQQAQQVQQQAASQLPPAAPVVPQAPVPPQVPAPQCRLDTAMPGPAKRPRLGLQLQQPGSTTVLLPATSARPAATGMALGPAVLAASTAAGAAARNGEEVVPLDTVLEAWEAHDRVNRQLAEAQQQLERRSAEVAELERRLATAQSQLAAAQAAPGSPSSVAAAAMPAPAPAATMAAAAAVQAQLADLCVLLPRSTRLQLGHLLPKQTDLQPHAAAVCDLACQAVEAALAAYASSLSGAAAASNPSVLS
ncbi:hypothetical protein ABPG75_010047 [Micractinium tetrahymenae]